VWYGMVGMVPYHHTIPTTIPPYHTTTIPYHTIVVQYVPRRRRLWAVRQHWARTRTTVRRRGHTAKSNNTIQTHDTHRAKQRFFAICVKGEHTFVALLLLLFFFVGDWLVLSLSLCSLSSINTKQ
jgi:hypothetical protein